MTSLGRALATSGALALRARGIQNGPASKDVVYSAGHRGARVTPDNSGEEPRNSAAGYSVSRSAALCRDHATEDGGDGFAQHREVMQIAGKQVGHTTKPAPLLIFAGLRTRFTSQSAGRVALPPGPPWRMK